VIVTSKAEQIVKITCLGDSSLLDRTKKYYVLFTMGPKPEKGAVQRSISS